MTVENPGLLAVRLAVATLLAVAALALLADPRAVLAALPEALRPAVDDYRLIWVPGLLSLAAATLIGLSRHAAGAAAGLFTAAGFFWVWSNYLWLWNRAWLPNPLNQHPLAETLGIDALRLLRTLAVEQRLVFMLIAGMLALTLLDALWRLLPGGSDDADDAH